MAVHTSDDELKKRLAMKLARPKMPTGYESLATQEDVAPPRVGDGYAGLAYQGPAAKPETSGLLGRATPETSTGPAATRPGAPGGIGPMIPGMAGVDPMRPLTSIQERYAQKFDPSGPTSPDPEAMKVIQQNQMRDALRRAGSQKQTALSSPVPTDPAERMARIDAIQGAQAQERDLNMALSNPRTPQTPDQIRSGYTGLADQGKALAAKLERDAIKRLSAETPEERARAQADLEGAMAMGSRFGQWSISDEEVQKRAAAQEEAAKRDLARKVAGRAVVDWQKQRAAPLNEAGYDAAVTGAQIGAAQNRAQIAAAKAAEAQSQFSGSPDIIKARNDAELEGLRATVADAQTKRMLAEREQKDTQHSLLTRDSQVDELWKTIGPQVAAIRGKGVEPADYENIVTTSSGISQLLDKMSTLTPAAQDYYRQRIMAELGVTSPSELFTGHSYQEGISGVMKDVSPFASGSHDKIYRGIRQGNIALKRLAGFLFPGQ